MNSHALPVTHLRSQGAASREFCLQLEHLIRLRQLDSGVAEMCREASHRIFFAMNEERPLRTGLLLPRQ